MHRKVAFIGSVGSGKTTMIETLSGIQVLKSDVESSTDIGKDFTTVGIDFGQITIDENVTLGLYGVPGQRKFSFIWDFVKEGLWATVVLVKNGDINSIKELTYLMEYFEIGQGKPCVVAITHVDDGDETETLRTINEMFKTLGFNIPVYSIDSRLSNSAYLIMKTLISIEESQ